METNMKSPKEEFEELKQRVQDLEARVSRLEERLRLPTGRPPSAESGPGPGGTEGPC